LGSVALSVTLVARRLAKGVKKVQKRFEKETKRLPVEKDSGGEPLYGRQVVTNLIADTAKDLDQAIKGTGEPGLGALGDWAAAELQNIQGDLAQPASAAVKHVGPRAVARLASLAPFFWRGEEEPARGERGAEEERASQAGSATEVVGAGSLEKVRSVLETIFVLAKNEDLKIDVEVTILPQQEDDLVLFPPSQLRQANAGATPTRGRILSLWRGIYLYRLERAPYPALLCPKKGERDWVVCKLDLVRSNGPILCDLQHPERVKPCDLRQLDEHGR
jgi:hypothetical protein